MYLILIIFLPVFFCMLTWVVVTVYRICFPEKALPFEKDPVVLRRQAAAAGELVPVGIREIREDELLRQAEYCEYHYTGGESEGLPPEWVESLYLRRN